MGVVVLSTQYEPAGQTDSKAGVEQYMPLGQSKEERSFSFCAKEQEKGGGDYGGTGNLFGRLSAGSQAFVTL